MAKIGIYGGSFNPVHNGHVHAAEEFVRAFGLDRLLVIPAGTPPHKSFEDGTPAGSVRAELLRLAMKNIPQVTIDETELNSSGKSYTYDTLISLKERFPEDELYLLIGMDMFLSFREWHRYGEILKLVKLVVFRRKFQTEAEICRVEDERAALVRELDAEIYLQDNSYVDVSSTALRRMLILGGGEPYMPAEVCKGIREHALYHTGRSLKNLPLDELTRVCMGLYESKRAVHAVGCSETAVKLAERYGADRNDAARAGILHDITKTFSGREQLHLCEKYAIMTDDYRGDQLKLLHGKTAAAAAKLIFGENDNVCDAISWHTTGRANMSLLEKIIYIADYVEPARDFDGVEELRALAFADLDAAVFKGICMTIDLLVENRRSLNRHSLEARDYLAAKGLK